MSGMLKKEDESEKAVTLEDQKKINQFSRLLNEKLELQSFLSVRKELLQLYEDASDELTLAEDDEKVQFAVGDAFILTAKDEAEETVEQCKTEIVRTMEESQKEYDKRVESMTKLKTELYGKFGNSINLEEEA
uniref:Prefoldin subunit 4 n=1 Tax=Rhodosorus marinus TaxID=101924 RepID=A0A7S3A2U6_9RHOD|mmetsp:Transcript_4123/g.17241  ORF Transcript_4123/g.17241 Transcript_4123/m.17241 type:complete len:133 (+) Transcript_4123:420-818(+)